MSYGVRHYRPVSPGRRLHRPDPQGREAGRPTGAAGDKTRAGHQPQDRQGARPHRAPDAARRREFIALLGGRVAGKVRAQQAAMPVIGFLYPTALDAETDRLRAFRQGLRDTGYVEGENVTIEYRFAHNQLERLPALAADLVRQPVALLAVSGGPSVVVAAKAATTTIPIVFLIGDDPVKLGFVNSLARPGGNLTGINFFAAELAAKRFELLREMVPSATRVCGARQPSECREHQSPR